MADVKIDEAVMSALANLLREFKGDATKYFPAEMEPAFRALLEAGGGGGEVADAVLVPLEVTENGEYTPGDGVDGFSEVVVNVPTSSGGLYDLFANMGYTVLFADGQFYNQDIVTVVPYEMMVENSGYLVTSTADAAGFYTRGAAGYTIGVFARFREADGYYTQYGTATNTATLPTIQSKGTGRKSYSALTGSANRIQTFHLDAGSYEVFLGTGGTCVLEILAIVIIS